MPGGIIALSRLDLAQFAYILYIVMAHHGPHGEVRPQGVHSASNMSAAFQAISDDTVDLMPGEERLGARRYRL